MQCPIKIISFTKPRDNAVLQGEYRLLHVYHGFRKRLYLLGYMLDAWLSSILMFVKVERGCWLANKHTRSITVTRCTKYIYLTIE